MVDDLEQRRLKVNNVINCQMIRMARGRLQDRGRNDSMDHDFIDWAEKEILGDKLKFMTAEGREKHVSRNGTSSVLKLLGPYAGRSKSSSKLKPEMYNHNIHIIVVITTKSLQHSYNQTQSTINLFFSFSLQRHLPRNEDSEPVIHGERRINKRLSFAANEKGKGVVEESIDSTPTKQRAVGADGIRAMMPEQNSLIQPARVPLQGQILYVCTGNRIEYSTRCYVFSELVSNEEVIARTQTHECRRRHMKSLMIGCVIRPEVLDLVVCNATMAEMDSNKDRTRWLMPSSFAANILSGKETVATAIQSWMMEYPFMTTLSGCLQIYIPVLDGEVWYLILIDFGQMTVLVMDPLKGDTTNAARLANVRKMLAFMDELLDQPCFEVGDHVFGVEKLSDMMLWWPTFHHPLGNPDDSGLYVMKWMLETSDGWMIEDLKESSRTSFLMNLVYNLNNPENSRVFRATNEWMVKNRGASRHSGVSMTSNSKNTSQSKSMGLSASYHATASK